MAATYVESSALVKRYVAEVGSAWVRRLVAWPVYQVLYTATLTEVEVRSALQRLVREGRLDIAQAQRLTQRVTQHFTRRYQVIRVTRTIVAQAGLVLERHPLRAYDAVQLASALVLGTEDAVFVTWDVRLARAAVSNGLDVAGARP
jgi:predicted nucleic acid-binding protein